MKILITICGRGGSKGIPGKNIRKINNIPLIVYSINVANAFSTKFPCDVTLSTDDENIKNVAQEYGLKTDYFRPLELATDESGKIDTILDILNFEESSRGIRYDYILDLAICSPLRNLADLEDAFALFKEDDCSLNMFSVNPARSNPYFNMVEKQENGYYGLVKKGFFLTRQSTPSVYDLNGSFYFYRRNFFDLNIKTVMTENASIYEIPHMCFDLDEIEEFEYLDYLITNNKLGFEL
jgi:CMP-N,N'-diacetyllegionaminic acid synthase